MTTGPPICCEPGQLSQGLQSPLVRLPARERLRTTSNIPTLKHHKTSYISFKLLLCSSLSCCSHNSLSSSCHWKTNKLHLHWCMNKHTNCLCLFYLLNIIHINISPSSFKDCKKVMLISSFIFGSLSDSCCPCYCQPPPNLFFILLKAKSIREPICLVFDLIVRKM